MAVTLTTTGRNAACDGLGDQVDNGTGNGKLVFETTGDVEIATINFNADAFAAAATGVASCNGLPKSDSSPANAGTIAQASIYDGTTPTAVKLLECVVGTATGTSDIQITSLSIATTDTVTLSALTITVPE